MKTTIIGSAVVITAETLLDDIKRLKKYKPDALVLSDENKDPVFRISTTHGGGTIDKFGIEFSDTKSDAEGHATCTIFLSANAEDIKEAVADLIGAPLMRLQKLEDALPDVIAKLDQERAAVMDSITIC